MYENGNSSCASVNVMFSKSRTCRLPNDFCKKPVTLEGSASNLSCALLNVTTTRTALLVWNSSANSSRYCILSKVVGVFYRQHPVINTYKPHTQADPREITFIFSRP